MSLTLNGATRVHLVVGDPIAQVKSPAGITEALVRQGANAVVVPAHVAPSDLAAWLDGVTRMQNVDSVIVTVPHKFAAFGLCTSTSARARHLGAINAMRRHAGGGWHGDMFDGLAYLAALRARGCEPLGRRALLVGAGGAGSAIAESLVGAGVSELAIHDTDAARRDRLIAALSPLGAVRPGSADPTGFDLVINATPMGMHPDDPLPLDVSRLRATQWVGCVITVPPVPPLLVAARALGCPTVTGADMFAGLTDTLVNFILGD